MTENKERKEKKQKSKTPLLEWIFALIGFVLVSLTIGSLLYEIITEEKTPPEIKVSVGEIRNINEKYLVEFTLENEGTATAADVTIEGELKAGERVIETSDVTVDYIPSKSRKKGGLFFSENPQTHDLKIRAKGYNKP